MSYEPLVTIIIPVYNGGNFLSEAIDSALNQTYKNIEIIVVNDGSKDDGESEKIALSYGDKIRYFLKENGGVSSALNFALEKAKGEWFSWLSHDDLYFPNKIEKQIRFINDLSKKGNIISFDKIAIHSATVSIDKNGKIIKTPSYKDVDVEETAENIILDNIYNYRLSGCSFLIPISAYTHIGGFNEELRTVSDVEYWYRLIFHGYQFYCLKNDILVKNRSHGKQVGKTKKALFSEEQNTLFLSIFNEYYSQFNPSITNIKRFYFGMIKRNIYLVAKFIRKHAIKNKVSWFEYYITIPIKFCFWFFVGKIRNLIRYFFRMVFVYRK